LLWIEAEFGMSDRTVQNFMSVCEAFGGNPKRVSDFDAVCSLSFSRTIG
jgi:hypothetical protein